MNVVTDTKSLTRNVGKGQLFAGSREQQDVPAPEEGLRFHSGIDILNVHNLTLEDTINRRFSLASSKLLQLLLVDYGLLETFQFMKDYFLLFHGELFTTFFEIAQLELNKVSGSVRPGSLQALLGIASRMCSSSDTAPADYLQGDIDKFLKINLLPYTLADHVLEIHGEATRTITDEDANRNHRKDGLDGYLSCVLDIEVTWPRSLVVSRQVITKYQLIFRLIFFAKYVEHHLNQCIINKNFTERKSSEMLNSLIEQKMHHFVNNVLYYMLFEVIEIKFNKLMSNLQQLEPSEDEPSESKMNYSSRIPNRRIETVEDLMNLENDFLDSVMRECLLTHQLLLQDLFDLLLLVIRFCQSSESRTEISDTFAAKLKAFITLLQEEAETNRYYYLNNLCTRLDYNHYFGTTTFF